MFALLISYTDNFFVEQFILFFGLSLCVLGSFGFNRPNKNLIFFLISNELFILGIIFILLGTSLFFFDGFGQIVSLMLLVVSAVETSVVLMLYLVSYVQTRRYQLPGVNVYREIEISRENAASK